MAQRFNPPFGTAGTMPAKKPMKPEGELEAAEEHAGGKPHMTHHHGGGKHTTVHSDGTEHHHESNDELKAHLDKYDGEQSGEGDDWGEEGETHGAY